MIKYIEQFYDGDLDVDEKISIFQNPNSKMIILYYPLDLKIVQIFRSIPNEYGSMGGVLGKKYEAIKDYLVWNNLDVKLTPLLVVMGQVWASKVNEETK